MVPRPSNLALFLITLASTFSFAGSLPPAHHFAFGDYLNLSLERSANFTITLKTPGQVLREVSAVNGCLRIYESEKDGFWLPAGQGILVKNF